ncbi:MAG TPA: hypothetical protein VE079_13395 [Ensifer sp.]|nr:hypothetical protein [Ensifer sp.]
MTKSFIHLLIALVTAELIGCYVFLVSVFSEFSLSYGWYIIVSGRMVPEAFALLPWAFLFSLPFVVLIALFKPFLKSALKCRTPFLYLLAGAFCGFFACYPLVSIGLAGTRLHGIIAGVLAGTAAGAVYFSIWRSQGLTRLLQKF